MHLPPIRYIYQRIYIIKSSFVARKLCFKAGIIGLVGAQSLLGLNNSLINSILHLLFPKLIWNNWDGPTLDVKRAVYTVVTTKSVRSDFNLCPDHAFVWEGGSITSTGGPYSLCVGEASL